jgi:hypothetical protein
MDAQVCTQCKIEKPLSDFYFSKNNLRGHATICLPCVQTSYERTKREMPRLQMVQQELPKNKTANKKPIRRPREAIQELPKYHGFVYLLVSENGFYKIGRSKNIKARLYGINREIPIKINLVHTVQSASYILAELFLHKKYANERVQYEWFRLSPEQVNWFCGLKDFDVDKLIWNSL